MYQTIMDHAEKMASELIAVRRDFHAYPEPGWMEMRTSSLIARKLTEYGCDEVLVGDDVCKKESRMGLPSETALEQHYTWAESHGADPGYLPFTRGGMTGVIGVLHCGPGPVIAMRFDIDALPITEHASDDHFPSANGFCSRNEGIMHACGHDGHATVGLGTVKLLCSLRDSLHGTVKFIFQPAEEGVRGAKSIVDSGHLDHVDYLLGAHMSGNPGCASPHIAVGDGASLATSKLDVIYRGKAAHAGMAPEEGTNAMLAMAAAVMNLQAIPRHGKAGTRINVGRVTAGTGRNIICANAKLELEVRGNTSEANDYMEAYARRIIQAAGDMHGCSTEIRLMGSARCGKNSPELCNRLLSVCSDRLYLPVEELPPANGFGSEDFSFMSDRVLEQGGQSCYFMNVSTLSGPLHNEFFDFEEVALVNGVKVFAGMAYNLMTEV